MPDPNPAAFDFLSTRRSCPTKTLAPPVPDRSELETLLAAAARTPDHGMLVPWRFVVLQQSALKRLGALAEVRARETGLEEDRVLKAALPYSDGKLAVAVVFSPVSSEKIPEIEQLLSAGAVCLSLVNAALSRGWGASWITGWAVYDEHFRRDGLGLAPQEAVVGMVHIGSAGLRPPERPRPDVAAITTWVAQ